MPAAWSLWPAWALPLYCLCEMRDERRERGGLREYEIYWNGLWKAHEPCEAEPPMGCRQASLENNYLVKYSHH